jgi:hypothetical protein
MLCRPVQKLYLSEAQPLNPSDAVSLSKAGRWTGLVVRGTNIQASPSNVVCLNESIISGWPGQACPVPPKIAAIVVIPTKYSGLNELGLLRQHSLHHELYRIRASARAVSI